MLARRRTSRRRNGPRVPGGDALARRYRAIVGSCRRNNSGSAPLAAAMPLAGARAEAADANGHGVQGQRAVEHESLPRWLRHHVRHARAQWRWQRTVSPFPGGGAAWRRDVRQRVQLKVADDDGDGVSTGTPSRTGVAPPAPLRPSRQAARLRPETMSPAQEATRAIHSGRRPDQSGPS